MNLWTMRAIDTYAGKFICILLQPFKWFHKKEIVKNPQKILIIKFWGIGSIVESIPAIKLLKEKYLQAKVFDIPCGTGRLPFFSKGKKI